MGKGVICMKSTGIVRKIDELGRIVLPVELRKTLGINAGDQLEIFVDGDIVMLSKYEPQCVFCGKSGGVEKFHEKTICKDCIKRITDKDFSN